MVVNGREINNQWVVPYNRYMCYASHINVEHVAVRSVVKYLYKYLQKGHDCAAIILETGTTNDDSEQPRHIDEGMKFNNIRIVLMHLLLSHVGQFLSSAYNINILPYKNFNTTYLDIS